MTLSAFILQKTSGYSIIDGDIIGESVSWHTSESTKASCAYKEADSCGCW